MLVEFQPLITAIFAAVLYSVIWWAAKNVEKLHQKVLKFFKKICPLGK